MNAVQKFQKAVGKWSDPFYRESMPAAIRLGEEAGEVLGVIKRIENQAYNGKLKSVNKQREALAGELGDVLSAVACVCNTYRMDMNEIAEAQIKKEAAKAKRYGRA